MKKTTIALIAVLSLLPLFFSCDKNSHDVFPPDELGMQVDEFYVEKGG